MKSTPIFDGPGYVKNQKIAQAIKRMRQLNAIIDACDSAWETFYRLDQTDFSNEFEINEIVTALEKLTDRVMIKAGTVQDILRKSA